MIKFPCVLISYYLENRHTGIVVYGNEYFFGGGIQHCPAGTTPYGTPLRVIDLGVTHVPQDVFEIYLQEINPRYTAETYNLLKHNCNNFSNEVAQFLVGTTIPEYILELPNEIINSPMGALICKISFLTHLFRSSLSLSLSLSFSLSPSLPPLCFMKKISYVLIL